MERFYYGSTIANFLTSSKESIVGSLSLNSPFSDDPSQKQAWQSQIDILKSCLTQINGWVFFEYSIPRMGRRIDAVLISKNVVFILEFKVGQQSFLKNDLEQVWDYAIDLNNFHKGSHNITIVPVLIATESTVDPVPIFELSARDELYRPIKTNGNSLGSIIQAGLKISTKSEIDGKEWARSRYEPTPTIIEAAVSLYNNHSVSEITRNEAEVTNLRQTSQAVHTIIESCKESNQKAICFVTGVPGAGKTLVGLDIATKHSNHDDKNGSVFLSGNGPLVDILREALTRDKVKREREAGRKPKVGEIRSEVKSFIQNVHHFRDEYLKDQSPPFDHIAVFDEAQRAWNLAQTSDFMRRKKGYLNFFQSEPEFLISCLDRHKDWATIVCLVGGGQEINKGEGGIGEWIDSINRSFPNWKIYLSSRLHDQEYAAGGAIEKIEQKANLQTNDHLHLAVSMRSFRAENLSLFVKQLLDLEIEQARQSLSELKVKYPLLMTRDLSTAKAWLRQKAEGSERFGIVVSSQAHRLKPLAIDVKSPMDPIHWFLDGKEDVRSSFYLEDVATEFHVQGLELDWVCLTWDADFRYNGNSWDNFSFVGDRWNKIKKPERQQYLKNAYRVLLTRARQGMIIVIPQGSESDLTRDPSFYDQTFKLLQSIGIEEI